MLVLKISPSNLCPNFLLFFKIIIILLIISISYSLVVAVLVLVCALSMYRIVNINYREKGITCEICNIKNRRFWMKQHKGNSVKRSHTTQVSAQWSHSAQCRVSRYYSTIIIIILFFCCFSNVFYAWKELFS